MYKLIIIFIFSTLFQLTTSITPPKFGCGYFTQAQWFNLITNDQITLEFGTLPLNTDIVLPYLYGCLPTMAKSATQTLTFQYNSVGLLTSSSSAGSTLNISYWQPPNNSNYYFFSATYHTNSAVTLNTFTDSNQRIVTIETSAFYQGNTKQRDYLNDYKSGGYQKRGILAPLGDFNYYYQSAQYPNLASTLNVAWNGIQQVTYLYNYNTDFPSNNRISLNLTTQLFQDTPFYVNYEYHYTNGVIDYYCVNSCNSAKVIFGYDNMGRLINSTSGLETLLMIKYDGNGNAVQVQSGAVVWTLSY